MQIDQALAGEEAKPKVEGHRLIAGIFRQPAGEIEVCFLQHVRRIEPTLHWLNVVNVLARPVLVTVVIVP